jgi:hypothetical protein
MTGIAATIVTYRRRAIAARSLQMHEPLTLVRHIAVPYCMEAIAITKRERHGQHLLP